MGRAAHCEVGMARKPEVAVEARRALGALLRDHRVAAGVGQAELAWATHYSRTSVSHIEAGRQFPGREFWRAADARSAAQGALVAAYDEVCDRENTLKLAEIQQVRQRARLRAASELPRTEPRSCFDDEQDAVELARRVAASDVGDHTVSTLEGIVDDLASAYATTAPDVLLPRIRRQLGYVQRLLDARKTWREHRRLLVVGGWLSLLGATVHVDLGHAHAATARLTTAGRLATDAEHPEIRAWCFETEAWRVLTDGDYALAEKLSRAAIDAAPAGSSAEIQATAQLGRACARMGKVTDTCTAISQVHQLVSPMLTPDRPEHHYRYDPDKAVAYTATTLAWLGDPAAETYAREVIARLGPSEDVRGWSRRVASAKLDLALRLVASGRWDEACDTALGAMASGRVVPSNRWRVEEVVTAVEARQIPQANDLREAYEQLRVS
jgi:hypothetical protein